MTNYLKMPKKSQIIALLELGWSYRRIEVETGVRRETVSRYDRIRLANAAKTFPGSDASPPTESAETAGGADANAAKTFAGWEANAAKTFPGSAPPVRFAAAPYHDAILEKRAKRLTAQRIWQDPGQKGAIQAPNGQSWTIHNNVIRNNHGTGIAFGSFGIVTDNYVHLNGQNGIGAYDNQDSVIDGNESTLNGGLFEPFWGAGGMKLAWMRGAVVSANNVHHNYGPGIWCDIDCINGLITNNDANDNDQSGIFWEISGAGRITGNRVARNGFNAGPGPAQAGIFIAESRDTEVDANIVEDNAWGIYAYQEPRGTGAVGVWQLVNLNVHGNTVKTNGRIGLEQTEGDATYFTTKNNRFEGNTYLLQTNTNKFTWADANGRSFSAWQGYGNDSPTGSATTY